MVTGTRLFFYLPLFLTKKILVMNNILPIRCPTRNNNGRYLTRLTYA